MDTRRLLNAGLTAVAVVAAFLVGTALLLAFNGVRFFILESGSMAPQYPKGSLCLVDTSIPLSALDIDDVVVYRETTGVRVMHRLIGYDQNGYVLKGDAATTDKTVRLSDANYVGVTTYTVPKLGAAIRFFTNRIHIVSGLVAVLVVLALLPRKLKPRPVPYTKATDIAPTN